MRGRALAIGLAASLCQAAAAQVLPAPAPSSAVLAEKLVDAKPGELRVFATAAIMLPLEAVRAQAQRAIGTPIRIEYGSARGNLKTQILAGQTFDVALLLPDVIRDAQAGRRAAKRVYPIARIPVAIGLRGDIADPDVSTPAALKHTLMGARSVRYAVTGAARGTVDRILFSLDLAGRITDTSTVTQTIALKPGEYEINFFPISEILQNHALRNLGLVPASLQVPAEIDAVLGPDTRGGPARAFVRFLQGPAIDPALHAGNMVKGR